MKKFESGNLIEVKVNQKVRILSGKLADYNKVWTVTRVGETFELKTADDREVIWEFEAEVMEVEIA